MGTPDTSGDPPRNVQLYDRDADPAEQRDVRELYPDVATRMELDLYRFASKVGGK